MVNFGRRLPDSLFEYIVTALLAHIRPGGFNPIFCRCAIELLCQLLRYRSRELRELHTAITSFGVYPTGCIAIECNMCELAMRMGCRDPLHILFIRIWRQFNLENVQVTPALICTCPTLLGKRAICINPYHYELSPIRQYFDADGSDENPLQTNASGAQKNFYSQERQGAIVHSPMYNFGWYPSFFWDIFRRIHHAAGCSGTCYRRYLPHEIPHYSPNQLFYSLSTFYNNIPIVIYDIPIQFMDIVLNPHLNCSAPTLAYSVYFPNYGINYICCNVCVIYEIYLSRLRVSNYLYNYPPYAYPVRPIYFQVSTYRSSPQAQAFFRYPTSTPSARFKQ